MRTRFITPKGKLIASCCFLAFHKYSNECVNKAYQWHKHNKKVHKPLFKS